MRGWTFAFDLDGTLIDTAPDLIRAANYIMRELSLAPVPYETLRRQISYGARHLIVTGLKVNKVPKTEAEIDALLDKFLAFYADNIAVESRPFDDLVRNLELFAGEGAKLVVCTNKKEDLSRKLLAELGLARMFGAVAGRDTFAVCKPDPGHLTQVIDQVGGDHRRAIMVGDSDVDIDTAKAARIPVVGVTFGYSTTPVTELSPDIIIDHYRELEPAMRRLIGAAR